MLDAREMYLFAGVSDGLLQQVDEIGRAKLAQGDEGLYPGVN